MRNVSQAMIDEFSAGVVRPAFFAEMFFDEGRIGMWTGYGPASFDGKDFLGGGNMCGISPITETQELNAKGIVVQLNGVSTADISIAQQHKVRGRKFVLYLGSYDTRIHIVQEGTLGAITAEDGSYIIAESNVLNTPQRIFSGMMDFMEYTLTDNATKADINLSVENALIIGERAKISRYTDEDQKKKYPGDLGLTLINSLQDKELVW